MKRVLLFIFFSIHTCFLYNQEPRRNHVSLQTTPPQPPAPPGSPASPIKRMHTEPNLEELLYVFPGGIATSPDEGAAAAELTDTSILYSDTYQKNVIDKECEDKKALLLKRTITATSCALGLLGLYQAYHSHNARQNQKRFIPLAAAGTFLGGSMLQATFGITGAALIFYKIQSLLYKGYATEKQVEAVRETYEKNIKSIQAELKRMNNEVNNHKTTLATLQYNLEKMDERVKVLSARITYLETISASHTAKINAGKSLADTTDQSLQDITAIINMTKKELRTIFAAHNITIEKHLLLPTQPKRYLDTQAALKKAEEEVGSEAAAATSMPQMYKERSGQCCPLQ